MFYAWAQNTPLSPGYIAQYCQIEYRRRTWRSDAYANWQPQNQIVSFANDMHLHRNQSLIAQHTNIQIRCETIKFEFDNEKHVANANSVWWLAVASGRLLDTNELCTFIYWLKPKQNKMCEWIIWFAKRVNIYHLPIFFLCGRTWESTDPLVWQHERSPVHTFVITFHWLALRCHCHSHTISVHGSQRLCIHIDQWLEFAL